MSKNEEHLVKLKDICTKEAMIESLYDFLEDRPDVSEKRKDVGRRLKLYLEHFKKNPGFDVDRANNHEKVGQMGWDEIMEFSWVKEFYLYLVESEGITGINGISEVKIDCGC